MLSNALTAWNQAIRSFQAQRVPPKFPGKNVRLGWIRRLAGAKL
jgi:hypothetical protein